MISLRLFVSITAASLCLLPSIGAAQGSPGRATNSPRYEVDPQWPQVLPFSWSMGTVNGLAMGPDDTIWVLHDPYNMQPDETAAAQSPPRSDCCFPAPEIMQFDKTGKVLRAWGGRNRISTWPRAAHGIAVDRAGNVWIAGVSREYQPDLPLFTMAWDARGDLRKDLPRLCDRQVLKLDPAGKLLLQIGHPSCAPQNNQDTTILGSPTGMAFDDAAGEVFIADGLLNKRIVVYDMNNGKFKRGWGAYGIPLSAISNDDPSKGELPTGRVVDKSVSPPKQFRSLTDIVVSKDGIVYVTDQMNNRIQGFTEQGKFVKEIFVAPKTGGTGSAWGLTLSRDARQQYLIVADGMSGVIRIIDRATGTEVAKVGSKGRNAGQFSTPDFVRVDSQGNLYVAEHHFARSWDGWQATFSGVAGTPGGRLQRFEPRRK